MTFICPLSNLYPQTGSVRDNASLEMVINKANLYSPIVTLCGLVYNQCHILNTSSQWLKGAIIYDCIGQTLTLLHMQRW
jgi:hypothetical protein